MQVAEPPRKRPRPGALAQAAAPSDSDDAGDSEAAEEAVEEETELPGAEDPSFAQQHALWREYRFVDVWLQARARPLRRARAAGACGRRLRARHAPSPRPTPPELGASAPH